VRVTIPENVTKRQLSIDFKPQRVTVLIEGEEMIHGDVEYELDAVLAPSLRPSAGHWSFVQRPRSTFAPRRGCERQGMQRHGCDPDPRQPDSTRTTSPLPFETMRRPGFSNPGREGGERRNAL
jgi:hypothetical protein